MASQLKELQAVLPAFQERSPAEQLAVVSSVTTVTLLHVIQRLELVKLGMLFSSNSHCSYFIDLALLNQNLVPVSTS